MENQNPGQTLASEQGEELSAQSAVDGVFLTQSKVVLAKKLLANLKDNVDQLNNLFGTLINVDQLSRLSISQMVDGSRTTSQQDATEKIVEGVFDGEAMIGPDGKRYTVSSNYASKSKLVEGDILKLSITASGTFLYKQIGPTERSRIICQLKKVGDSEFMAIKDNKTWRILTASVTYFKGDDGDEVVILVPKVGESRWAAVENVIKQA
jgi:hypothetical protein